jgi:transcriptional regulator with XRE-family HTH domain
MPIFHTVLHRLRKRYIGKQLALATSLGCTEAAVSFWEHGRRLPQKRLLQHIVECLLTSGAESHEVDELRRAYVDLKPNAYRERRSRTKFTQHVPPSNHDTYRD